MNRFLLPGYVVNSVRVLVKKLRKEKKESPYQHYNKDVEKIPFVMSSPNYTNLYKALSYMDHSTASKYYKGSEEVITIKIMLALFYYNEQFLGLPFDKASWLNRVDNIYQLGKNSESDFRYYITIDKKGFGLRGSYYSGIIQAKAASLFLRAYKETAKEKYLIAAKKALKACLVPIKDEGILREISPDMIWAEEYCTEEPNMVLNGKLFVLIALAEYQHFDQDQQLKDFYQESMSSVISWLPYFLDGTDLYYSMHDWRYANVHYKGVVHYLLDHLFHLTKEDIFKSTMQKNYQHQKIKMFKKMLGKGSN